MKYVVLLCTLSIFVFTGCHNVGGGIRLEAGFPHGHHAPPAHAPAHGRRHHMYHYYPNAEFYFDVGRNMYFYLDTHGQWSFSVNLPLRLRSHLHSGFVEIEMEHDRPYLRHKHYRNKYRKNSHKYKRKYKAKQHYKDSKKKHRNKQGGYFGAEDDHENDRRKYKKKQRYKDSKKKHRNKQGGLMGEKEQRKKRGGYLGDEDDDDRRKRDRRNDRY